MLVGFSTIFVADTRIIFSYNLGAPVNTKWDNKIGNIIATTTTTKIRVIYGNWTA